MGEGDVGFGVVGCGVVAEYHIRAIAGAPGARLCGVAEAVAKRAREVGEREAVPWFTDFKELIRQKDVQVVCVCTPSGLRLPIVEEAARHGKHLVVEKPLDVTVERADRIIGTAARAGVKLMGVFQLRYGQGVRRTREAIAAGRLGTLVLADAYIKWFRPQAYYESASWRGTWELEGGGALMTQGIHTVDLLRWIAGPVKSVRAKMATLVHRVEVEDTIAAVLEFESGALGVIEATTASHPGMPARLEFSGSKGTVVVEADQIRTWDVEGEEGTVAATGTTDIAKAASDSKTFGTEGHLAQITEMVRVVREGASPTIDGREARKAVELIEAIYQSARSGEAVALPLT